MWLRRGFFQWLLPAAIVLPAWLLVGWAVFNASGWAFLGILFVAAPAVLVGELVLALLIRARPTVRTERAVSWWDVLGLTVWHALIIVFGCFIQPVSFAVLVAAIIVFLAVFWSSLAQLWNGARGSLRRMSSGTGPADLPDADEDIRERARQHAEVIVVHEVGRPGDGRNVH
ncbi:MFS transporter permease [Microbacterium sp. KR10-403]|uniref:MFS transporter permease n=1 Tax=Microbacterium sp. KR10-403 TaxID=3158581 RepID=UPI0032E4CE2D